MTCRFYELRDPQFKGCVTSLMVLADRDIDDIRRSFPGHEVREVEKPREQPAIDEGRA